MPVVEIVGPAPSTYTRVARMVCEEKQIPYELKQSLPHSPDVDAIHPFGKVPVMRHGDFELCESKAISTYLDLSRLPGRRQLHACRHQRDADSRLPEELSGIGSRHSGGEVALGLLRPPRGAAELPEHGAAAAAGQSILTHCIRPPLQ